MENETLGDAFPREQARCRELLGAYKEIGPAGAFACAVVNRILRDADDAAASGDVVRMLRSHEAMKECK